MWRLAVLTTRRRLCSIMRWRAAKSPLRARAAVACSSSALSSGARRMSRRKFCSASPLAASSASASASAGPALPSAKASVPSSVPSPGRCGPVGAAGASPRAGPGWDAARLTMALRECAQLPYRAGSSRAGSIGLPWRRISKCSCTFSASLEPISAILCPRRTTWSSFTSSDWLCA